MSEKLLPTKYILEVYENSFANDVSRVIESSTPFMGFSVGDYFEHRNFDGWQDTPKTETEKFVITQINHFIWTLDNSYNAHQIMITIEKKPYKW